MKLFLKRLLLLIAFISAFSISSFSHSGRTDRFGGHHNRTTGEYHTHNSGSDDDDSKAVVGVILLVFLVVVIIGMAFKNDDNHKRY
jgi:hypothetical protein